MGANVILRPYDESMRDDMLALVEQGTSYNLKPVAESVDDVFRSDGILYRVIFDAESGEFLGDCDIHDTRLDEWEVGIKIVEEHWGEGVGTAALELFLSEMREGFCKDRVVARIMPDNAASIGLFRKFGVTPRGIEPSDFMRDEGVADWFKAGGAEFVDDSMGEMARLFGVDPEELPGSVLVFDVPTDEAKWKQEVGAGSHARQPAGSAIRQKQEALFVERLVSDLEQIAAMGLSDAAEEELQKLLDRCKGALGASESHVTIRKVSSDE